MSDAEDPLVPVYVPALLVRLATLERKKGAPLTEQEVLEVRDVGTCVMLRRSQAAHLASSRGYDDLDPARCWEQWLAVRERLRDETPES